jgi:nitric oxide dioxygenase
VTDVLALQNASLHVWYEKGATTNESLDGVRPLPCMQFVRSRLLERGVAPRDIQYEVFGPDLWQADLG